jgi:REP element-mobilizing transposase RayT
MDGEQLDDERSRLFKQYIASYVRTTGGSLKAAGCGQNKIYLLVGLNHTRSLADFVRDLKLVSRTYARRKLNAPGFFWQDEYEAFSVSLSQLERVRGYIGRQLKLESQESYASSWQPLTASKMY